MKVVIRMNYGLLFTLFVGLFIFLGALIVWGTKNNERISNFSISLAFGVMISLILLELIPEQVEIFEVHIKKVFIFLLIVCCAMVGMGILKLLDRFIPDHEPHGTTKKAKEENLVHIGIISSIAVIIHNIIEGMALYSTTQISVSMGAMLCLGIGLHNIPMGMIITSAFSKKKENKKKTILWLLLISLSTFVGGLFLLIFNQTSYDVLGVLLGITTGMLLYICFFELLPLIKESKYKKDSGIAMLLGILILFISTLF